jgi:hypothetical protein
MEEDSISIKKKKSSDSVPALEFNAPTSSVDNSTSKSPLPDTQHTHQQKNSSNNYDSEESTSNHQDFPEIRDFYTKYVVYLNFPKVFN